MLRPIAIALMLVLSVGIMLPFSNSAHGVRQTVQVGKRRLKRHRSRAWWRRYRARLRQKKLEAEMAHKKVNLSLPQNISVAELQGLTGPALAVPVSNSASSAALPPPVMINSVATTAPEATVANGATRPRVVNAVHPAYKAAEQKSPVQMNLAVVGLSRPNPSFLTSREEKKMLGGLDVGDLRRMVIDKMVNSGGWVVNDFIREVDGARVFVVSARTPKDALTPEKAWTFYFTEAGGRIYGLTTDAPVEFADRMTSEAERFIHSLRAKTATSSTN